MTEYKEAVLKYKARLNAIYGVSASGRRGRPISTGTGTRLCIYLPVKTMEMLDRISKEWSGSRSDIIQEAIARYAAELDGVMQEGGNHG